jgi:hypothetical protein
MHGPPVRCWPDPDLGIGSVAVGEERGSDGPTRFGPNMGGIMDESILSKALRLAPLGTASAILFGLEHAPKFTLSVLNGLATEALSSFIEQREQAEFTRNFTALMAKSGPWPYGPETAALSNAFLAKLPPSRPGVVLLDPYYFDPTMVYGDGDEEHQPGEGQTRLYSYAYRLLPVGVFALNYDPRRDDPTPLVQSVTCIAFLRGSDLWGKPLLFTAMWIEGLPLGAQCAFQIPRWGTLRRAADEETRHAAWGVFQVLCQDAVTTDPSSRLAVETTKRRLVDHEILPTPVERGFPNLVGTVWHGAEPFPGLTQNSFEYELIGANFRQRQESVPLWFRPGRGWLG